MCTTRIPGHGRIVLIILGIAFVTAVAYGAITYQTPYGCDSSGVATGPGVDWQVLAKPCIYIYFTGVVGGSVFLILLIPVPEKKTNPPAKSQQLYRVAIFVLSCRR